MPLTVVRHEAAHLYADQPTTPAARSAVEALLRLHHAEEQEVEQAQVESGLTKNEFHAIRYLLQAERDGREMGPKDLAVMLNVSNASVTKVVDNLVAKGQLERVPHPTDRRAMVLKPIDGARDQVDRAYARFHTVLVAVIDSLPDADNELLAKRLNEVAQALIDDNGPLRP
ncbi:MarR family winged helix-turn-helix transcriptional regulator [Curtobacterium ammoniigenes]|uniref:MarR family winged helix-turn-helix transcriptional regulator n=1 Tax=Curtobacterium ammoniigenes TaxID=395387 RepID=UPI0008310888|nr:MarR family transcriptional regulator [Curtobacterium ammoniigenes]